MVPWIPLAIIIFCLMGWHFSSLIIQLKVNSFCAMVIFGEAPTTHGLHLVSVGNSHWAQQEIRTQDLWRSINISGPITFWEKTAVNNRGGHYVMTPWKYRTGSDLSIVLHKKYCTQAWGEFWNYRTAGNNQCRVLAACEDCEDWLGEVKNPG